MKAVIAPQHDHCVVSKIQLRQLAEQTSDKRIDVTDASVVTMPQLTYLVRCYLPIRRDIAIAF